MYHKMNREGAENTQFNGIWTRNACVFTPDKSPVCAWQPSLLQCEEWVAESYGDTANKEQQCRMNWSSSEGPTEPHSQPDPDTAPCPKQSLKYFLFKSLKYNFRSFGSTFPTQRAVTLKPLTGTPRTA